MRYFNTLHIKNTIYSRIYLHLHTCICKVGTGRKGDQDSMDGRGHTWKGSSGIPSSTDGQTDLGWRPDGLYTAPCDEALKWDIVKTKEMGYNMIRKHIKVDIPKLAEINRSVIESMSK